MLSTAAGRRLLSGALVVLAVLVGLAGLLHGVEELVWDAAARSYAYREPPGSDAVALAGVVVAALLLVAALRLRRPVRTRRLRAR